MARNETTFEKGKAKGRPPGTKNKFTISVKDALMDAFGKMQENPRTSLYNWGKANPTEFYKLCAKLLPTEIKTDLFSRIADMEDNEIDLIIQKLKEANKLQALTVNWHEEHPEESDDKAI